MKTFLTRIGLASMLAVGSLAALAPVAHADDFGVEFRFGNGNDGVYVGDGDRYRDGYRHGHRHWRDREMRRGCNPNQALDMARYQGIRRARIADVNPRVVVVKGRGPYGWERMVFANVRGCPVIDR